MPGVEVYFLTKFGIKSFWLIFFYLKGALHQIQFHPRLASEFRSTYTVSKIWIKFLNIKNYKNFLFSSILINRKILYDNFEVYQH
jgi:hypothetical protein